MTERLTCVVPGCRCSRKQNQVWKYAEWLCPKHWKMVDPSLRERHKQAQRLARKIARRRPLPLGFTQILGDRWQRCKDDVTMKLAMGLAPGEA